MPLVLAHNDVVANPAHAWEDVEGVHYHYPSKYQSMILTGEPFVYYRGVHRANGRRGPAEYVGAGRVGAIWPDPRTANAPRKALYCAVEGYRRFPTAVPAKLNGANLEDIPSNRWRDGVRRLVPAVYKQIMDLAGGEPTVNVPPGGGGWRAITASDQLIIPPEVGGRGGPPSGYRRSKEAKRIGDWAEEAVLSFLKEQVEGCTNCVHRAAIRETPGWDIDYVDRAGVLQRVEVKGTVSAAFVGVELTAGEMRAARKHGGSYWLYLVANCLTDFPKVQAICDPERRLASGAWTAAPAVYAIKFSPAPTAVAVST